MVGSVETHRRAEVASNISRLHHKVSGVFAQLTVERERERTREIHTEKLRERNCVREKLCERETV